MGSGRAEEGTRPVGSAIPGGSRGGNGGLGASSEQMGDMLDPDTDMLGEVAGELLTN